MSSRRRGVIFGIIVVACSLAAVAVVVAGVRRDDAAMSKSGNARRALLDARTLERPVIVFRNRDPSTIGGQLAVAPLGASPGRRTLEALNCDRVYFAAAGKGLCLARGKGFAAGYRAEVFGSDLRVRHELKVEGVPSRARVSADGRYGSVTMFVTGHSYAEAGKFATQTTLIDLASGDKIADLEQFSVTRGDQQLTAVDMNFWGVTFARDSDRFYATLATGEKTYLIEGSVSARTARVVHENVECPSLSPDGTRIAYKRRAASSKRPWRLTVLDLATMHETPLAELRSVDDQVEWLDDDHVLYGVVGSIWTTPRRRERAASALHGAR